jgi:hypothetical protein
VTLKGQYGVAAPCPEKASERQTRTTRIKLGFNKAFNEEFVKPTKPSIHSFIHLFVNLVCSANIAYSRALPDGIVEVMSEGVVRANRAVWELASQKHVREYDELLEEARTGEQLAACEREILEPVLRRSPLVVHLQSGHGLDDIAIVRAGARRGVGVDYSQVAASAAARRAPRAWRDV